MAKQEQMIHLVTDDGKPVLMKSGEPFTYTSREWARIGKRVLENLRKISIKVVGA